MESVATCVRLVLFEPDAAVADAFEQALAACSEITMVRASVREMWTYPGLTAVLVSLPAAEKWGSRPVFHQVQILPMSPKEQEQGLPPYVLANIAFRPEERPTDHAVFEMVVNKLAEAIQSQLSRCPFSAWTVGIPGHQIGVGRISVHEIAGFLRASFCAP